MSYPPRCEHNVIACDKCAAKPKDSIPKEQAIAMSREIAELRNRIRGLEQQLADKCDEAYESRQQMRQLEVVNDELRRLGKGGG